jgi:hypothetical protein
VQLPLERHRQRQRPSRNVQQTVYTVSGLSLGRHTLTLTKTGGTYLVIDRFDVR